MPENFASLLEALDAEGRGLARPAPAAVIETLGRSRRRRHRFTAATSAVAVCALAAGVALSTGGAAARPNPITPVPSPTSTSSSPTTATSANRTGTSAFLQPSELPQPSLFQWTAGKAQLGSGSGDLLPPACGFDPTLKHFEQVHSRSQDRSIYTSAYDESTAWETIYHFSSAAAARADYERLKPDPATCSSAHVTATVTDGAAWQDTTSGTPSQHKMIFLSGGDIAYWSYDYADTARPYDTSDDQAALQRMADRLDGRQPVPDPVVAPPAGALPGSAWLAPSQIPFATADQSHGWVPFGGQQQSTSSHPSANLCESITEGDDFVAQQDAIIVTRSYHGSPSNTPVYPGSNYLYSSAEEHIISFAGPAEDAPAAARMAFAWSKQILVSHGCRFTDGSGARVTREIKVVTPVTTSLSLLATDTTGSGTSYEHLYCVVKGSHVAWMVIGFEHGDTSTDGDSAILASMAAHLP